MRIIIQRSWDSLEVFKPSVKHFYIWIIYQFVWKLKLLMSKLKRIYDLKNLTLETRSRNVLYCDFQIIRFSSSEKLYSYLWNLRCIRIIFYKSSFSYQKRYRNTLKMSAIKINIKVKISFISIQRLSWKSSLISWFHSMFSSKNFC